MAGPDSAHTSSATRTSDDGGDLEPGLKIGKRTRLPQTCVKCGSKEGLIARRRTMVYVPKSLYVAFLFGCVGMVLGLFLCVIARETTDLMVWTCPKCTAAWRRASRLPIIVLAGSFAAAVAASGIVWVLDADRVWLPVAVGLLALSIGPIATHVAGRKNRVWARDMDKTSVTLVGVHPQVVAELSEVLPAPGTGHSASLNRP